MRLSLTKSRLSRLLSAFQMNDAYGKLLFPSALVEAEYRMVFDGENLPMPAHQARIDMKLHLFSAKFPMTAGRYFSVVESCGRRS